MSILSTCAVHKSKYARDDDDAVPITTAGAAMSTNIACLNPWVRKNTQGSPNPDRAWWPSKVDFETEAFRHSKYAVAVSSMQLLVQVIQTRDRYIKTRARLTKVLWFGHGARGVLDFGDGDENKFVARDIPSLPDLSSHFAAAGHDCFLWL